MTVQVCAWQAAKSKTPQQADGASKFQRSRRGVFDPRGSRQISMQAWLLGSLLRGNKEYKEERRTWDTGF